jgi:mRNA-degrading endonuclease toxin of MazEF toxin-antitoxin module
MVDEATKVFQQGKTYGHFINNGDIVWANLGDEFSGNVAEPGVTRGTRPCLVVGAVGKDSPVVTLIPMTTSKIKADNLPALHIKLTPEETGLESEGTLLVEQITTVSKRKITHFDSDNLYIDWENGSELKHTIGAAIASLMF